MRGSPEPAGARARLTPFQAFVFGTIFAVVCARLVIRTRVLLDHNGPVAAAVGGTFALFFAFEALACFGPLSRLISRSDAFNSRSALRIRAFCGALVLVYGAISLIADLPKPAPVDSDNVAGVVGAVFAPLADPRLWTDCLVAGAGLLIVKAAIGLRDS